LELHILGTRGIPAKHGGFETFAEHLSLYCVSKGHKVTVYCQLGPDEERFTDMWRGVHRIGIPVENTPAGTILFDLRSALDASKNRDTTVLTLGYNTAIFSLIHRFRGVRHLMNMDGIEWMRKKWSRTQRLWLWANEWFGLHLADSLIADHPEIKLHLQRNVRSEKISVIPYGADAVTEASCDVPHRLGLTSGKYFLVVARPEPENSILEIINAYKKKWRPFRLVVLGNYFPEWNEYHAAVLKAAEQADVIFPGAIYDVSSLRALRFHAAAYIHGHQVGGTNPSLVESLAAGNAVIAHDNKFNQWVAGPSARFFSSVDELASHFDILQDNPEILDEMKSGSIARHHLYFKPELVLRAYEQLLLGLPITVDKWSQADAGPGMSFPVSIPEPFSGRFNSHVQALLRHDREIRSALQPCIVCGKMVAPKQFGTIWLPGIHWAPELPKQVKPNRSENRKFPWDTVPQRAKDFDSGRSRLDLPQP
jgi:glycosyltransferase involved in cell wall biosynthesis